MALYQEYVARLKTKKSSIGATRARYADSFITLRARLCDAFGCPLEALHLYGRPLHDHHEQAASDYQGFLLNEAGEASFKVVLEVQDAGEALGRFEVHVFGVPLEDHSLDIKVGALDLVEAHAYDDPNVVAAIVEAMTQEIASTWPAPDQRLV